MKRILLLLLLTTAPAFATTTWTIVQQSNSGFTVSGFCPRGSAGLSQPCTWGSAQGLTQIGSGHQLTVALLDNWDGTQQFRDLGSVYDCATLNGSGACDATNTINTWTLHSTCNAAGTGATNTQDVGCATVANSVGGANFISITRTGTAPSPPLERWAGFFVELNCAGGCTPKLDDVQKSFQSSLSTTFTANAVTPTGNDAIIQFASGPGGILTMSPACYESTVVFWQHFGTGTCLNTNNGAAPVWTWASTSSQATSSVAWSDGSTPATFNLSVTLAGVGSGTVTSSPAGINCPGSCTATFNSGTSVTLTEAPSSPSIFNGWGGACLSSGLNTTCPVVMNSSLAVTASFAAPPSVPTLPTFIDNNELTCGITAQCKPNSPGLTYTPPTAEYLLGSGSTWISGPPAGCTFTYANYTLNEVGIGNFMVDMEKCRSQHNIGIIFDIPPGQYTCSSCLVVPQTNTTVTHATTPLIVRTSDWQALQAMAEPIGAGGIQANVPASTQIGLRNPSLDGKNLLGLSTECPAQSASGGGLAYQLGMSTICIPAGGFTLANGVTKNTATDYNYLQHMVQIIDSGTTAPLIFCSVVSTAPTTTCNNPSTLPQFGPDLWHFEGIVLSPSVGNTSNLNLINVNDASGNSTSVSQWASHIHFRRMGFIGDWTNLTNGSNQIAATISLSSCYYCSVVGSQASQILRPGAEGHIMGASGSLIKISNNWFEGQSSCIFVGGSATAPTITPIGSYVGGQDIEERRTRCTFPLAWLGSPYGGGNVPNSNAYWGGAGDDPSQPTLINVDVTGLILTYVSGPVLHDSTSFWPGNNVTVNGVTSGCWNGSAAVKCKLTTAGSWPQVCPPTCFPPGPTQLTLQSPVCNATCTGALTTGLTNVTFVIPGASIVRKNGDEKKSFQRYLMSGNIVENVDPSGGQRGIAAAFSNANTSGGGPGTNYQNTLVDLNAQDLVYQNSCWDVSMRATSNPGGANGGGTVAPIQRFSFYNVAHLNITSTNPGCSVVGATTGMQVNVPGEVWTGTVTENGAGTQATFGSTLGTVTSVDVGAPLVSDTASRNGFSGTKLTLNVTNASVDFPIGSVTEYVHFPCTGCAGDPGVTAIAGGDYPVTAVTSSTLTIDLGTGAVDPGALNAGTKIQGPVGLQVFNIPDGFPVFLSGCTPDTSFNSSTTGIGPLTISGGGSAPWNGSWTASNSTVTFSLVHAANTSTTCTLSNLQGGPNNLYIQKNTFITDAASPLGTGNSPQSNSTPYSMNAGIQDNLMLNSGAVAGKAGWFNPSATLGEGNITEVFQFDVNTLTASNLLIPRKDGSSAPLYNEYCNNNRVPLTNCTPTAGSPPHMYFPFAAPGFYASCLVGFLNACSGVAPLNFSDPHGYGLAATSPYFTAASDGTPIGVDFTKIDTAQTNNTYVPTVMGQAVTVAVGPFPDSLQGAPPPTNAPTAPAASAFASLRMDQTKASSVTGGTK